MTTPVVKPRLSRETVVLGVIAFFVTVGFGVGYTEVGAVVSAFALVRLADATQTTVQTIDPQTRVQLTGSAIIHEVADEVDSRLRKVLAGLESAVA